MTGTGNGRRRAALLAGCALVALTLGTRGVSAQGATPVATPVAAASSASYAIPPGPVASALAAFGATSGVQIVYDSAIARGLTSPGVSGTRTPEQALAALLAGTGLNGRFTSPRSVTIEAPARSTASVIISEDMVELDAITVSGEKLARDLSDVYSSVGIVTGEQFFDYAIEDLNGALNKLANTRVSSANRGNSGIVIRGLSSDGISQPTNSSPTIAVIVDGASQNGEGIRRGNRGTWDVADVEVFRGPQSTLQGRNAMGGAVVVNTNDPTWTTEAALEGDIAGSSNSGDFGSGAFMLSGPMVENQLAFRVAGQYFEDESGIAYADPLNEDLGQGYFGQLRAKFLLTPAALDGFAALFTISHTSDRPSVSAVTGPDFFARRFDSDVSAVELRQTDVTNVVANVSQDLGAGITLRSVTAFIQTDATIESPQGAVAFIRDEVRPGKDFTEDLRLELEEGVRPLSGVIGLNIGRFSYERDSSITVTNAAYGLYDMLYQDLQASNTLTSYALYADMRYAIAERWSLMFGGRLGYETVDVTNDGEVLNLRSFGYDTIDQTASTDYTVALPKIGVAYEIDDKQNLAFTVSEGFRAGFAAVDTYGNPYEVEPETLWAYEVAYRSKWFDDRLEVNVNGFYYKYTDLQITVEDPNPLFRQSITMNAGKAHAYGAEFELRARLTQEFTAFASLGLLKTEFDSAVTATGDYTGNEFPEAPAATFNIGGVYRHASGFFASADLSYTDGYYSVGDVANTEDERVSAFTLVNAAVGYEAKNWSVTLYAKNIFDEQYLTSVYVDDFGSEANIGDGRVIGVRARATF
ncbi:TonB-dependent receptor domain-containing protein [Ancylobacter radicis]|uniref:TonB-dependent receptor domain-containing protein n=1 Tax=Ancylobacter radicis TaxID=2836179 RepID=UPI002023011C|nr:TonB-dependent receptor [Ancylobacter radicis]